MPHDSAIAEELEQAPTADLVERVGPVVRFKHPLWSAVAESRAQPRALRAAHRRAAAAAVDPVEQARHLAEATAEPDDEIAALLDEAARTAHARGDVSGACWLADRALALTPDDGAKAPWSRLRSATAWGIWSCQPDAIQRGERLLAVAAEPAQRFEATELLGWAHIGFGGSVMRGDELFEQALREPGIEPGARAGMFLSLASGLAARGMLADAARRSEQALDLAEPRSPLWAHAVGHLAVVQRLRGRSVDRGRLETAARLLTCARATPPLYAFGLGCAGVVALLDDEPALARERITAAVRAAELSRTNW